MQRPSLRPFRTKYLEPERVVTFTGSMSSCMSSMAIAPTTQQGFSGIRPGLLSTGFNDFSPAVLPGCGRGTDRAVPTALLPTRRRGCERKYGVLPGNWDMTKTSGTACCCLITWRRIISFLSVYDNAKGCSTSLGFPSRGPDARLMRLTPSSRRLLKKLLRVDKGSRYPDLVRR